MKKIGMIVATIEEMESVLKKYGKSKATEKHGALTIMTYEMPEYTVYICNSGWGEIAAASAVQLLISLYKVDIIVNYGVVGGLTSEMSLTKTCVVTDVVHYDFDTSPLNGNKVGQYDEFDDVYIPTTKELWEKAREIDPDLKPVICASADKFVEGFEAKNALHEKYKADICEMEAAAIALTCYRNNIPCLLIKSVSDSVTGGQAEFNKMVKISSDECMKIVNKIVGQI